MHDRKSIKQHVKSIMRGTWGVPLIVLIVHVALSLIIGSVSYERGGTGVSLFMPNNMNNGSFQNSFFLTEQTGGGETIQIYGLIPLYSPTLSIVLNFLIMMPIEVSICGFFLMYYRGQHPKVERMFDFFGYYINALGAVLWRALFQFLWSLLFIIPGIVKSYAYFFIPYIIAENPNIGPRKAMKTSIRLTNGFKMELFMLDLSFIGWHLLNSLTLGILSVWIMPYVKTTYAAYYDEIKRYNLDRGIVYEQDFMPG